MNDNCLIRIRYVTPSVPLIRRCPHHLWDGVIRLAARKGLTLTLTLTLWFESRCVQRSTKELTLMS